MTSHSSHTAHISHSLHSAANPQAALSAVGEADEDVRAPRELQFSPAPLVPCPQVAQSPRFHFLLFAALLLLASLPYYFSLANTFSADDWAILYYYRDRSILGLFSPRVLWFYRPLQSVLYAALYHIFGLNPVPYNLASLALYFAGCAGWFALVWRLFRSAPLALLAAFFMVINWEFCDTLFWKANYGGQLAWLGALAALHALLTFWRGGGRAWLAAAAGGLAFALLAKESAVNLPALAGLVWLYEKRADLAASPCRALRAGARGLVPLLAVVALYLGFHTAFVRDVETVSQKGYEFARFWAIPGQYLFALQHLFFFFGRSPFLPALNVVAALGRGLELVPLLLLGWALWRRDAALLFALLFTAAALTPTIFLVEFHASRFYLMPAAGMGLAWALLVRRAWGALALWAEPAGRRARLGLVVLLALAALRSEAQLFAVVEADCANTALLARLYNYVADHRAEFSPGVCLVFDGLPDSVTTGLGLRQMAKILLRSEQAEAIKNGMPLGADYLKLLNTRYPDKVRLWIDPATGQVRRQALGNAQLQKTG